MLEGCLGPIHGCWYPSWPSREPIPSQRALHFQNLLLSDYDVYKFARRWLRGAYSTSQTRNSDSQPQGPPGQPITSTVAGYAAASLPDYHARRKGGAVGGMSGLGTVKCLASSGLLDFGTMREWELAAVRDLCAAGYR